MGELDYRGGSEDNVWGEAYDEVLLAEVVRTIVYLQNRMFADGGLSPTVRTKVWRMFADKLYFGKKLNLGHLRLFSNIAYVHVLKEKRRKLDAKAEKCILVGYLDEQ